MKEMYSNYYLCLANFLGVKLRKFDFLTTHLAPQRYDRPTIIQI